MKFDSRSLLVIFMTLRYYLTDATPTPQIMNNNNNFNTNYNSGQRQTPYPNLINPLINSMVARPYQGAWSHMDHNSTTYWEDDPSYPLDRIKMLGNMLRSRYEFFFTRGKEVIEEDEILAPRVGGSEEYGLCDSRKRTVFPRRGETRQNQLLYIVNVEEMQQGVSVEECTTSDTACAHSRLFPSGTTATCRQHYTYHRLVALSKDGKTITDYFKFPSCCKCMLSDRGGGLYNRFGGADSSHTDKLRPTTASLKRSESSTPFTFSP